MNRNSALGNTGGGRWRRAIPPAEPSELQAGGRLAPVQGGLRRADSLPSAIDLMAGSFRSFSAQTELQTKRTDDAAEPSSPL